MELFSEIYSAYYNAVTEILSEQNLSKKDIISIINRNAFSESSLYIVPAICGEWELLSENNGIYNSKLKNTPSMPLTETEKQWLKAVISDSRSSLFIDDDTKLHISEMLKNTEPLFNQEDFLFFDRFSDGDDFSNPDYIEFFRILKKSIPEKRILEISFTSSKNKKICHRFLPLKLEYSPKNDKFRLICFMISEGKAFKQYIINLSRITAIKDTGKIFNGNIPEICGNTESVCVEVSSERNGIERFMLEFAGYEKITEFNEENGKCTAEIWYSKADETELLIRLLSFGTVLEIKSPEYFRNLARERIKNQCDFSTSPIDDMENL